MCITADARMASKRSRTGLFRASSSRSLSRLLVSAAAFAASFGLPAAARAGYYPFAPEGQILERHLPGGVDEAYQGPRGTIADSGTSLDEYKCPSYFSVTNWMVVPDDLFSATRTLGLSSTSGAFGHPEHGSDFAISTTNWSGDTVHTRAYVSCTNNTDVFPYDTSPLGDYLGNWVDSLERGAPDYAALIREAFGWASAGVPATQAASAGPRVRTVTARRGGNRFALSNGTNQIAIAFVHGPRRRETAVSRRPPAIYLAMRPAGSHCLAQRMYVDIKDDVGSLLLELQCHGLKEPIPALVTILAPVRRIFHLRNGGGSVSIDLHKPPGDVGPFVYLTKAVSDAPCGETSSRLSLRSNTFDLRLRAHCEKVTSNANGSLYVGGLLSR